MTKIGIISDIHANKHALDLVLKDMEKRGVNKIYCLGDIVTKYFYPQEVVDSVRANADIVIKGNCDQLVVDNDNYKFARGKLGLDRIEYLDSLPTKERLEINKVLVNLYHSNPHDLESMFNPLFSDNEHTRYKDSLIKTSEYNKMFEGNEPQTTISGHTHMNYIGVEDKDKLVIAGDNKIITPNDKSIINVGSVGEHVSLIKNNEGQYDHFINPYITYLIVDDQKLKEGFNAEIIKVPYTNELVKVYLDSVKNQINGNFPDSPVFTNRMKESIMSHDISDEARLGIEEESKKYEEHRKER